jgi:hypothetical protein
LLRSRTVRTFASFRFLAKDHWSDIGVQTKAVANGAPISDAVDITNTFAPNPADSLPSPFSNSDMALDRGARKSRRDGLFKRVGVFGKIIDTKPLLFARLVRPPRRRIWECRQNVCRIPMGEFFSQTQAAGTTRTQWF